MEIELSAVLFPALNSPSQFNAVESLNKRFDLLESSKMSIEGDSEDAISKIWVFLDMIWPESVLFIAHLCRKICVLPLDGQRWTSWSSLDEPYCITATISLSDFALSSETLIHEASHLAFYRLESIAPIFVNGATSTYRHYWKPGDRPARGALLAAHAFINVSMFYEKLANSNPQRYEKYSEEAKFLKTKVREVLHQFETRNDLTSFGRIICNEMLPKT